MDKKVFTKAITQPCLQCGVPVTIKVIVTVESEDDDAKVYIEEA